MSFRILTISEIYTNPYSRKAVPAIRLQGRWMEKLGFGIGKKVTVYMGNDEITIKLLKDGVAYGEK